MVRRVVKTYITGVPDCTNESGSRKLMAVLVSDVGGFSVYIGIVVDPRGDEALIEKYGTIVSGRGMKLTWGEAVQYFAINQADYNR